MIVAIIFIGQLAEQPQPLTLSHTKSSPPKAEELWHLYLTVYYAETWPASSAKQITVWLNDDSIRRDVEYPLRKLLKKKQQRRLILFLTPGFANRLIGPEPNLRDNIIYILSSGTI